MCRSAIPWKMANFLIKKVYYKDFAPYHDSVKIAVLSRKATTDRNNLNKKLRFIEKFSDTI